MAKFTPKITRARFVVSGLKSHEMLSLGEDFNRQMQSRIKSAHTIEDGAAKPLSPKYLKHPSGKRRYGSGSTVRDLVRSGRMLRSMKVIQAHENKAVIYFTDPLMVQRMAFNQSKSRQWGVSPKDREWLVDHVGNFRLVKAQRVSGLKIA